MKKALYREWRPVRWEQVIGQDHIITTLKNAVAANRVGHAYLFGGPRGTGKTTTARLLAKAVNCLSEDIKNRPCNECDACQQVNQAHFLDLIEIDAASNTSVDDVRELRDKINFSPTNARFKVYIIDEVHMLSTAAFNALLKTLEEPPPHAIFILATTEIHKIPATVLSRCQRYEFRRVPVSGMVAFLEQKCKSEKIKADSEALTLIARQATGSMRDAISLLDQLSSTGEKVTLELTQTVLGTATQQNVVDVVESIIQRQPASALNTFQKALDSGTDPRQLARQVVEYLRSILLFQANPKQTLNQPQDIQQKIIQQSAGFNEGQVLEIIRLFNRAAGESQLGWQPSLPLELALVEALQIMEPEIKPVPAMPEPAQPAAASVQPTPPLKRETAPPAAAEPAQKPAAQKASHTVAEKAKPAVAEPQQAEPAAAKPTSAPKAAQPTSPKPAGKSKSDSGLISLGEVLTHWKKVKETVRKSRPATEGLLNSCQPISMKGDQLVLNFANNVIKSKMDTPDNLELTRQALKQIFGIDIDILCVVGEKLSGAPLGMEIVENGMVQAALNQGGVIKKKE